MPSWIENMPRSAHLLLFAETAVGFRYLVFFQIFIRAFVLFSIATISGSPPL